MPAADPQDEPAGEAASVDALDANANSPPADDASTYFELRADLRRCASPLCGGWFLRRLNQSRTTCHDGHHAETCYTPAFDWSEANLPGALQAELLDASSKAAVAGGVRAIVRGRFVPTNRTTPRPELGAFVVTEAWVEEGDAISKGVFVKVNDNGVRCFAAPCPSLIEKELNTRRVANIAEVDFTPAGLSDRQIEELRNEMFTPRGILVAGDRYTVHVDSRTAKGRTATAAYLRLADTAQ